MAKARKSTRAAAAVAATQSIRIDGGRSTNIGVDQRLAVGSSQVIAIGKERQVQIGGSDTLAVKVDEVITIGGAFALSRTNMLAQICWVEQVGGPRVIIGRCQQSSTHHERRTTTHAI
jgi:hypothetical protein